MAYLLCNNPYNTVSKVLSAIVNVLKLQNFSNTKYKGFWYARGYGRSSYFQHREAPVQAAWKGNSIIGGISHFTILNTQEKRVRNRKFPCQNDKELQKNPPLLHTSLIILHSRVYGWHFRIRSLV